MIFTTDIETDEALSKATQAHIINNRDSPQFNDRYMPFPRSTTGTSLSRPDSHSFCGFLHNPGFPMGINYAHADLWLARF